MLHKPVIHIDDKSILKEILSKLCQKLSYFNYSQIWLEKTPSAILLHVFHKFNSWKY